MKPSDFQKTVQCRFESCLKKVVRSVVKDYYKELNRRKNKEISFSELPDVIVDKMTVWDDYETDYTIFSVYEICIIDHGIGMTKEQAERICDEFYMADKSRARKEGGAGIGMSLVAIILEHHNAVLSVESEPGCGTTMRILLPW